MSRILWINPLGTSVFDATIGAELNRVKRPTTEVEVRSLKRGPHHLEYHAYEAWVTTEWHAIEQVTAEHDAACPLAVRIVAAVLAFHRRWSGLRSRAS